MCGRDLFSIHLGISDKSLFISPSGFSLRVAGALGESSETKGDVD